MYTTIDSPDFTYLCKLIHESIQLPVYCNTNAVQQQEWFWSSGLPAHPYYSDLGKLFRLVSNQGFCLTGPVIHETNYLEQFAVVPVRRGGQCQTVIVIGPVTRQRQNSKPFIEILNDKGIPVQEREKWMVYWNSLPYVDRLRLLHVSVLANWMVNQETLDITDVLQSSLEYGGANQQKEIALGLADRREYSIFHEGIADANQMFSFIRRGEKTKLMEQLVKHIRNNDQVGVQSKRSHLRSVKNLAICGIALSSHAAVEGGLSEELAMTLCDLHVQHIEELNELASVEAAVIAAIADFADRVGQCLKDTSTKSVLTSKEYIYLHLFEKITLQQLSEMSGRDPHYLSQQFKKQTGLTLMNYIQRERIEEAKKLLDHTNDTISSIGARLTFYDQAHFVKVFKKYAGVTPKQYRNRNQLS